VERFAVETLTKLPPSFVYHCLEHTVQVVENAKIVAKASELPEHETGLVLAAAWMHDIGFQHTYAGHEAESCRMARDLLSGVVAQKDIAMIESAIRATEIPQHAENRVSEVLCDADLLYLGGDQFFFWSARLREEHLQTLDRHYSDREWLVFNLDFLHAHRYYTDFARNEYGTGHDGNIRLLEHMARELS